MWGDGEYSGIYPGAQDGSLEGGLHCSHKFDISLVNRLLLSFCHHLTIKGEFNSSGGVLCLCDGAGYRIKVNFLSIG